MRDKSRGDRIDPFCAGTGPRELPLRGSLHTYQAPYVFSRADSNVRIPVPTYAKNTVLQFSAVAAISRNVK